MRNQREHADQTRTTNASPLTVGQALWYVPDRGDPFEVEVTKIGRKWASIGRRRDCGIYDKGRIAIDTMSVDGGGYSSPGKCYSDREDYEREQDRARGWRALQDYVRDRWAVPDDVMLDNIVAAMRLINPAPLSTALAGERRGDAA